VLAQGGTVGPATDAGTPSAAKGPRAEKIPGDDGVPECMRLWDKGTHMSRQEWARTCRRIQSRLENLKVEELDIIGPTARKKGIAGKEGGIAPSGRTN
jgi:hypothetical protein